MEIEDKALDAVHRKTLHGLRPVRSYRILGRFHSWKRLMALWGRLRETGAAGHPAGPSLFGSIAPSDCTRILRKHGIFTGLQLPVETVDDILRHAHAADCLRHAEDTERFRISEVENGLTPGGRPVTIADVSGISCAGVDRITHDPILIEIVRSYLGYKPKRVARRLYWSPVSELPDDIRRNSGQTIDYHYDIEPRNSLYAYFYITGADRKSGAHVAVRGSHRAKPLPIIWSSAFQPEARVLACYGAGSQVTIEGASGFGFLEDPACFHKALPPRQGPRLMLQLRYS